MEENGGGSVAEAQEVAGGPGAFRRTMAKAALGGCMILFGGIGWFSIPFLTSQEILDPTGKLNLMLTGAALLVGVIIGGILGAKIKQALLK